MENVITLNGIEFDLSKALPLLVGDWRALEKQGVSVTNMSEVSVEKLALIAQCVLKKARPDIADNFVDGLTLTDVTKIATAAPQAEEEALETERPT